MRLLIPNDPFNPKQADEQYLEEAQAAASIGLAVSLFSFEDFQTGSFRCRPLPTSGERIVYRGWMMPPTEYRLLVDSLVKLDAEPVTTAEQYEACHYLPAWIDKLADLTPETLFFSESDDVEKALRERGWEGCFLKDYVKSLSTDGGSLIRDLAQIQAVVAKMKKYRGCIEGGLCARKIEDFDPASEKRHFVINGIPFSNSGEVPDLVKIAAQRINTPFFSVDTICRGDGVMRIVELGDGQVSDLKEWSPRHFMEALKTLAS